MARLETIRDDEARIVDILVIMVGKPNEEYEYSGSRCEVCMPRAAW
jgi:hypothetical protein